MLLYFSYRLNFLLMPWALFKINDTILLLSPISNSRRLCFHSKNWNLSSYSPKFSCYGKEARHVHCEELVVDLSLAWISNVMSWEVISAICVHDQGFLRGWNIKTCSSSWCTITFSWNINFNRIEVTLETIIHERICSLWFCSGMPVS